MSKYKKTGEEVIRGFVLKDDKKLRSELELTDRENVFVEEYLSNGFDHAKAAFKAVNAFGEPSPNGADEHYYWQRQGHKFLRIQRVKDYIATHHKKTEIKLNKVITIESVVGVLDKILHTEDAENKDRIKAGEILLKYLNAFEKHETAKSPKSLTIISKMSPAEIEAEMAKMISTSSLKDDNITDVETID